jgi:hypothetical protein
MPASVIPCLAVLKVNWDEGRSYIENFVPFVAEAIRTAPRPEISLGELQSAITDTFGLTIPQGALQTLLKRAAKHGYIQRVHGIYRRDDKALAALDFTKVKDEVIRRCESLLAKLIDFCEHRYQIRWSPEEAERALLAYLEQGAAAVLRSTVSGDPLVPPRERPPHAEFLVGAFVAELHKADPAGFDFLETVVKGSMLAGALFFADLGQVERRFDRVQVFFDTAFLLQALSLEGPGTAAPRRELLALLYEENADLRVFEDTVDEVRGVLSAAAQALRHPDMLRDSYGAAIRYLAETGRSPSDVELIIARLDNSLRALRIQVARKPAHVGSLTVDEAEFQEMLQNAIGYQREEPLRHDLDCITSIHRLRGGRAPLYIESCDAIFITTNDSLVRVAGEFFRQEYPAYRDAAVPHCLLDHVLTTIVWLKKPLKAPDLPRKVLVADCYAAMNPPDHMWRRYLAELDRLESQGDISPQDFHLLRFSLEARNALMDATLGATEAFTEGTVAEVLEKARAAARAEVEGRLAEEVAAREAAEAEAADVRSQLEARREEQLHRIAAIAERVGARAGLAAMVVGFILIAVVAYLALLFPDLPGGWWMPIVAAAVVLLTAVSICTLAFGTNLRSATRQLEVAVARRTEAVLRRVVGL